MIGSALATRTERRQIHGSAATRAIANLRRKVTPVLTAAGFERTSFSYSNESREHAHYPTASEQTLDHLGISYRPGIILYAVEPRRYQDDDARLRAQIKAFEMAVALTKAGIVFEVEQSHSRSDVRIILWADENGLGV